MAVTSGIFGFLFVAVPVLITTLYAPVAAAIQKGPYTATVARECKKSIRVFENIRNSGGMSHRREED